MFTVVDINCKKERPEVGGEIPEEYPRLERGRERGREGGREKGKDFYYGGSWCRVGGKLKKTNTHFNGNIQLYA